MRRFLPNNAPTGSWHCAPGCAARSPFPEAKSPVGGRHHSVHSTFAREQYLYVELCLSLADFRASALTKQQRRNQRRRERPRNGCGTRAQLAVHLAQSQNERRTETGSSSREYGTPGSDDVNRRARKPLKINGMAPQVGFEPTTLRLTAECSTVELLRSKVCHSI